MTDIMTVNNKAKKLLISSPQYFDYITLITDEKSMNNDSICALLESEMKLGKAYLRRIASDITSLLRTMQYSQQTSKDWKNSQSIARWNYGKLKRS